ncbi:MAG: DUF308 domain-containing protein [Eggerthellaceae bacterium]|nr:DUF308 domain-containing protein [Eggerthellaceae bacterium]
MSNSVPLSVYDGPRHRGPGGGDTHNVNIGLLLAGAIITLFGILCLKSPHLVTTTMALFMGVGLVISGVIMISLHISASWSIFGGNSVLAPSALITFLIGLVICLEPVMTGRLFATILGIVIFGMGILQLGSFLRQRPQLTMRWYAIFMAGILECILGLACIVVPDFIGISVGIFALIHGILMMGLALPRRR